MDTRRCCSSLGYHVHDDDDQDNDGAKCEEFRCKHVDFALRRHIVREARKESVLLTCHCCDFVVARKCWYMRFSRAGTNQFGPRLTCLDCEELTSTNEPTERISSNLEDGIARPKRSDIQN